MKIKLKESSIQERTRLVKLLGIDFNVSEINGKIFFSFMDKKAASIQLRQVGTNKIVNFIQNRLDIAYGKGEFFFKGGNHAEFQNGYLFQRNTSNLNLNKIKFESIKENTSIEAISIAQYTGTRKDAVQSFIDTHKLNAKKLLSYVAKGKMKERMDFATAIAGKDGNPMQKKIIKMFEAANAKPTSLNEVTVTRIPNFNLESDAYIIMLYLLKNNSGFKKAATIAGIDLFSGANVKSTFTVLQNNLKKVITPQIIYAVVETMNQPRQVIFIDNVDIQKGVHTARFAGLLALGVVDSFINDPIDYKLINDLGNAKLKGLADEFSIGRGKIKLGAMLGNKGF